MEVSLDDNQYKDFQTQPVKVCGNECGGYVWGSNDVAKWFSSVLGIIRCWLVKYHQSHDEHSSPSHGSLSTLMKPRNGFENEAPLLLISRQSVDILNKTRSSEFGCKSIKSTLDKREFKQPRRYVE